MLEWTALAEKSKLTCFMKSIKPIQVNPFAEPSLLLVGQKSDY